MRRQSEQALERIADHFVSEDLEGGAFSGHMAKTSEEKVPSLSLDNNGREYDIEKAPGPLVALTSEDKDVVSWSTKATALVGYFICNVGLTLYNKAVLGSLQSPWLLTALHAGSASIGCFIALKMGHFKTSRIGTKDRWRLLAFSFLFTINIAISNVSLSIVTIPFHQIVRATCPLFTTMIYRIFFSRHYPISIYLSLLPVTFGVVIASYGNIMYTPLGFALTFLGVILAAVKTIVTNRVMTGSLALGHWEVLLRLSPLAFIQSMVIAYFSGEVHAVTRVLAGQSHLPPSASSLTYSPKVLALVLAGNGALAFLLNVSSFSANKLTGALTMTVCANLKQCLTIVLGFWLFHDRLTFQTGCGVVVTVFGGVVYNLAEIVSKKKNIQM